MLGQGMLPIGIAIAQQRHRLVMDALKQELEGGVHALSIHVSTLFRFKNTCIHFICTWHLCLAGQNINAMEHLWRVGCQFTTMFRRFQSMKQRRRRNGGYLPPPPPPKKKLYRAELYITSFNELVHN